MPELASGLIYYVVFLFSTTLHEASHAWAALQGGDPTAYHGGQVTLDPIPHIRREPIGMVVLPLLGVIASGWPIGFASAPFDPEWALRHPRRAALMALAGPASNFLLVVLAGLFLHLGLAHGIFQAPESVSFDHIVEATDPDTMWRAGGFLLSVFFSLNLLLGLFNLLPFPPLDGAGVPPLFLHDDGAHKYQEFVMTHRGLGLIGIVVAWQLIDKLYHPVWLAAVNLIHLAVHYG
ncbi:MAG TPA: site-2 protease family protein [Gemmatimonadales bacterium]|nr:site-2 protease family protein [Gemmatimonadales bacterium]